MDRVSLNKDLLYFLCPGCKESHAVSVAEGRWLWNKSLESPTISPSILVKSKWPIVDGKMIHPFSYVGEYPCENGEHICHSYVVNGRIQFLGDCSHVLAGQTVDLPDWDEASHWWVVD